MNKYYIFYEIFFLVGLKYIGLCSQKKKHWISRIFQVEAQRLSVPQAGFLLGGALNFLY